MSAPQVWMMDVRDWPVSRFKDGEWEFIETVKGTYADASDYAGRLQGDNPDYQYRIWDCR